MSTAPASSAAKSPDDSELPDESSPDFIRRIVAEVRRGYGIVPFIGSGVSARSGILMGVEFTSYLTWTVFRCVASPDDRAKVVPGLKHWNVRRDGWPRPPTPEESLKVSAWVMERYRHLCGLHGLTVHADGNYVKVLTPDSTHSPGQIASLDSYLRRPLLPTVLRKWGTTEVDDEGTRRFLRVIQKEHAVLEVLSQVKHSPDSEEAIIERGIRSLHDWRGTLEFLARLGVRFMADSGEEEAHNVIVDRDSSVIDSFNLHITRGRKPNLAHTMICHLASPLHTRLVLTTNFDTLQEDAFEQLGNHYEEISVSIQGELPSPDTVHSLNCIVKLHGSLTETRADYSLDDQPAKADKDRFYNYITGAYPLEHLASDKQGRSSDHKGFLPNHILVCGYSGSDARCVQMIKYVLDHSAKTKVFWICFNDGDRKKAKDLFQDRQYANRIHLTITERMDLLLLELYQSLTLRLPKGGFSYQYSHDVPPKLWEAPPELEGKLKEKVDKVVNAVKSLGTKYPKGGAKPIWVEVEDSDKVSSGLTVVLHYALKHLRDKEGYSTIWTEMEDFANPPTLLHHILQVISLRLGLFQLEHAVLVPGRLDKMLKHPDPKKQDDAPRESWEAILRRQLAYLRIAPSKYALFFYGRNVPGMCAGWEGSPWKKDEYASFHAMLKALAKIGFPILYAPLTQTRIVHSRVKAADIRGFSSDLLDAAGWRPNSKQQSRFYTFIERVGHRLDSTDVDADTFSKDFDKLKVTPEHAGVRRVTEIIEGIKDKALYLHRPPAQGVPPDLADRSVMLYTAAFFRASRPLNVFLSEPVYASPRQFNLGGFDNDWHRFDRAREWLKDFGDSQLLWRKAGGNYWFFRDARLGLQYMLSHCILPGRGLDFPAQATARTHYQISEWYFRAHCTTNHAAPLCEALFHLYRSIVSLSYSSPAKEKDDSTPPKFIPPTDEDVLNFQKQYWLRSVAEWTKLLRLGRNSLLFWMDRPAAKAWFEPEHAGRALRRVEHEMLKIFSPDQLAPDRLSSVAALCSILKETKQEKTTEPPKEHPLLRHLTKNLRDKFSATPSAITQDELFTDLDRIANEVPLFAYEEIRKHIDPEPQEGGHGWPAWPAVHNRLVLQTLFPKAIRLKHANAACIHVIELEAEALKTLNAQFNSIAPVAEEDALTYLKESFGEYFARKDPKSKNNESLANWLTSVVKGAPLYRQIPSLDTFLQSKPEVFAASPLSLEDRRANVLIIHLLLKIPLPHLSLPEAGNSAATIGSPTYAASLLRELKSEMASCWNEFAREPFVPHLPVDAIPPFGATPGGDMSTRLANWTSWSEVEKPLAKASLYRKKDWRINLNEAGKRDRAEVKIGDRKLTELLESLEKEEAKPLLNGIPYFEDRRKELKQALRGIDAYRELPQVISILSYLTHEHIRRAKIIDEVSFIREWDKPPYWIIPSAKEARPLWRQVNTLSRLVLSACAFAPPALADFELQRRATILAYHGLALGHLGRFYEAHRRLNEAAALSSKFARRFDTVDLAVIKLRRAEVHLLEACQLDALAKLDPQYGPPPRREPSRGDPKKPGASIGIDEYAVAKAWYKLRPGKRPNPESRDQENENDRLLWQLYQRLDGRPTRKQLEQMTCAKVDDAWAAIEGSERMLAGRSRTSPEWGRLCTLKLQVLSLFSPETQRFKMRSVRRRNEFDEELRRLLRLSLAVWPDDPWRRLRQVRYFILAWSRAGHEPDSPKKYAQRMAALTKDDLESIEAAFNPCGYKFRCTLGDKPKEDAHYYYLLEYAYQLKARLRGKPPKKTKPKRPTARRSKPAAP